MLQRATSSPNKQLVMEKFDVSPIRPLPGMKRMFSTVSSRFHQQTENKMTTEALKRKNLGKSKTTYTIVCEGNGCRICALQFDPRGEEDRMIAGCLDPNMEAKNGDSDTESNSSSREDLRSCDCVENCACAHDDEEEEDWLVDWSASDGGSSGDEASSEASDDDCDEASDIFSLCSDCILKREVERWPEIQLYSPIELSDSEMETVRLSDAETELSDSESEYTDSGSEFADSGSEYSDSESEPDYAGLFCECPPPSSEDEQPERQDGPTKNKSVQVSLETDPLNLDEVIKRLGNAGAMDEVDDDVVILE